MSPRQPSPIDLHARPWVKAPLVFANRAQVCADREYPHLLRAPTVPEGGGPSDPPSEELHHCRIDDLSAPGAPRPDLCTMGFDVIDLADRAALQRVFGEVARAGALNERQARAIRRELVGSAFTLSSGGAMRVLHVASEGMIVRRAGPNGLSIDERPMTAMNHHRGAAWIHGDQDVHGTPLRQLLGGLAPRLFRHDSPQGSNLRSPLFLLNVWVPLRQLTRPLVLMDRRTLDKTRQQARYALPVTFFEGRRPDMCVNDIWQILHDDAQRWFFSSRMDPRRAYVFDTLGLPHGTSVLPGEEVAEELYLRIRRAVAALDRGDEAALRRAASDRRPSPSAETTLPLREAVAAMDAVLAEVADGGVPNGPRRASWRARADVASDAVVRVSIEMRCLAFVTPPLRVRRAGWRARRLSVASGSLRRGR